MLQVPKRRETIWDMSKMLKLSETSRNPENVNNGYSIGGFCFSPNTQPEEVIKDSHESPNFSQTMK